jgi:NHL repeat
MTLLPVPALRSKHIALLTLALVVGAMATFASPADAQRRADGNIANFAGTPGQPGFAGDGGPAGAALMNTPSDVAFLTDGSLVIADRLNNRVRRVTTGGQMQTAAGGGSCGGPPCGDGGQADDAELSQPRGVTSLPDGGYLVTDSLDHRVRRVLPDGRIVTVAGSSQGLSGDGGPAAAARLSAPTDTAVLPDGSFLIADTANHRIRHVGLDGRIRTVAGTTRGFSGDGGPATAAQLDAPSDIAVLTTGGYVIADTANNRLRRVDLAGNITTLAGTGPGLSGDGDPARNAQLRQPLSVAGLPNGGVLVADTANNRVRRVTPLGAIIAVAGSTGGNSGNGGPAKGAQLSQPNAVTTAPGGGFAVTDTANATVRRVSDFGAVPPAVLRRSLFVEPGGGNVTVQPSGAGSFLPLREEDIVPNGSQVDATNGTLSLFVARTAAGDQINAQVYAGPFAMRQLAGSRPFTEFRVTPLTGCPRTRNARASRSSARPLAAAAARRRRRRVWVRDRGGRWRTRTGSITASSIGTRWLTTLRCDGTSVTVREGRVRVFDRVLRRTRILRRNQTYLARNVRPGRRRVLAGT